MRFEAATEVGAAPAAVWSVLADVERWPEWTASMTSVRRLDAGELRAGSEALVRQPGLRPATWRVTDLDAPCRFVWESRMPGLRTVAGHFVTALGGGRSTVRLTIDQTGPLAPLVGLLLGGLVRRHLSTEVAGLRRRSEAG